MIRSERFVGEDPGGDVDRHADGHYTTRAGRASVLPSTRVNAPRLILQASCAGLYGALLLAVVLRVLHPEPAPLDWAMAMVPVLLVYTLAAGILWPLLYGVVRFFASRPVQVPVFSLRYVMSFHVANASLIMMSLAVTLWRFRRSINPEAAWRLEVLGAAVALTWVYAAIVCIVPMLKRRVALPASAAGLTLAALLAPVWSPAVPAPAIDRAGPAVVGLRPLERRLVWLDFDGADLEDVLTLEAQGKLPAFSRLRREGAFGRLQSLLPCATMVTRATLSTGRMPYRSGVPAAWSRDLMARPVAVKVVPSGIGFDLMLAPFMTRRPLTVGDRRAPALWDIAVATGGTGMAEGWEIDLDQGGSAASTSAERAVAWRLAAEFLESETADDPDPGTRDLIADLARAAAADDGVARAFEEVEARTGPGVYALCFPGIDRVAHRFLRYARPGGFGNVTDREVERFGQVLERYYIRLDAFVARGLRTRGEDGLLLVTSSYGMEPVPLWRRIASGAISAAAESGTHDGAPWGFLFAFGPGVRHGATFGRASIADVLPTALYALNLPIARDLHGSIVEQVLTPGFTLDHPAIVIDTYGHPIGSRTR